MNEQSNAGSALLSFLVGAAIGTVAGLLFAPRPGRETRERLQDLLEDLQGKGQEMMDEGRELWGQGKQAAQDKAEQIKSSVESATRKVWGDRA